MTVEQVTPEQARRWIRHSHQRPVDLLKCRMMLDDVEAGRWDPSRQDGTPVIVRDEVALDGHHRLVAILMLGQPLGCVVTYRP